MRSRPRMPPVLFVRPASLSSLHSTMISMASTIVRRSRSRTFCPLQMMMISWSWSRCSSYLFMMWSIGLILVVMPWRLWPLTMAISRGPSRMRSSLSISLQRSLPLWGSCNLSHGIREIGLQWWPIVGPRWRPIPRIVKTILRPRPSPDSNRGWFKVPLMMMDRSFNRLVNIMPMFWTPESI